MTKEITLIRHTTPRIKPGICYGRLDLDVTDSFVKESNHIQEALNGFQPDMVYTSSLKRCSKLAAALFPQHSIKTDERLMEMNFGHWEGTPWDKVEKAIIERWANDFIEMRPPNGESFRELIQRCDAFVDDHFNGEQEKIAVVTHSGIIRSILSRYLDIAPKSIFKLHLNYGCIIRIRLYKGGHHQVEFIKG